MVTPQSTKKAQIDTLNLKTIVLKISIPVWTSVVYLVKKNHQSQFT